VLHYLLLDGVNHLITFVLKFVKFSSFSIGIFVELSFSDHAFDFAVREATVGADGKMSRFTSGEVLGRAVKDAVGVEFICEFYSGGACWSHQKAIEEELSQELVFAGDFSFALVDRYVDAWLVVLSCCVDVGLLGWDWSVSMYDF